MTIYNTIDCSPSPFTSSLPSICLSLVVAFLWLFGNILRQINIRSEVGKSSHENYVYFYKVSDKQCWVE